MTLLRLEMGPGFKRTIRSMSSMGRAVLEGADEGLGKGVKLAATAVVRDYLSGQSLKRRSSMLADAVDGWMEGTLEGVVGVREDAGVNAYKWLLGSEDRTIVPKNSKFLAIPIGEGLTPSGVPRYRSPRDVKDGFFVRTGDQLLFGRKNGKRGKFRELFVMKKSVFVQGTDALYDGTYDSLDEIAGEMEKGIARKIGAA